MTDRRRLLLTRPRAQSEAFCAALALALPHRFDCLISPMMEIAFRDVAVDLDGVQGVLFTSANGVAALTARTDERSPPALCVGPMTAAAAEAAGFAVRTAAGDVAALAQLAAAEHVPGAGPFLHVRGRHAAGDLAGRLGAAGVPCRAVELYDQAACPLGPEVEGALAAGEVDAVALFSPRSSRLFADTARRSAWDLRRLTVVALSAAAADPLAGWDLAGLRVAPCADRQGMIDALATL